MRADRNGCASIALAGLCLHAAAVALGATLPEWLAPAIAASVYLPLWPLAAAGAPVFASAAAGGWAGPSAAGWLVLLAMWAGVWWSLAVAGLAAWRFARHR